MKVSHVFVRLFFILLSILFMMTYTTGVMGGFTTWSLLSGLIMGIVFGFILIGIDVLFRRFNLRSFNTLMLGLFFGYLLGLALVVVFDALVDITALSHSLRVLEIIKVCLFLFGTYMGVMMTFRAADEISVSIPFIRFSHTEPTARDLVIDGSILGDPRIVDLASSGLIDQRLVLPRFILKDLYTDAESLQDTTRTRARRSLEILKKLEELPNVGLRYNETDFPEVHDTETKAINLARLLDGDLLTAEISKVESSSIEGVRIINIHSLANALKRIMQAGETLTIRIQRAGKEPLQGVGYLEDGTMVVVNGGGDYIGEDVQTHVLSVKHTASGRMIFCNLAEEEG